jgi:hypothetical protein
LIDDIHSFSCRGEGFILFTLMIIDQVKVFRIFSLLKQHTIQDKTDMLVAIAFHLLQHEL